MAVRSKANAARVLMTADAVGGVWTYALDLARGLSGEGIAVTLAGLGPSPNEAQRAEAGRIAGLELVDTGLPLDWTAEAPDDIEHAGRALAGLAGKLRPDLIHLNSPALAGVANYPAPVVGVCHSCVATWWTAVKPGEPLPEDFRWRTKLTAQGYAAADALVANSQSFADATAGVYGLPKPPIAVLNGRRPLGRAAPVQTPDRPFAFTAGRLWDEGKGVATLDRAAAALSVPVFAAGSLTGPHGGQIALSHIRSLGQIGETELAGWLAARPIFVSPALYEPFGLAVLEAAQAGCPLVLSDIPTFRELWDGAALFVPPHDDRALANAIERLADDPAFRDRLGAAARERAGRYTVEAMVAGTLEVYRTVAPRAFGAPAREAAA